MELHNAIFLIVFAGVAGLIIGLMRGMQIQYRANEYVAAQARAAIGAARAEEILINQDAGQTWTPRRKQIAAN